MRRTSLRTRTVVGAAAEKAAYGELVAVGDVVEVCDESRENWYPASVLEKSVDGTFVLEYADGSGTETAVLRSSIRRAGEDDPLGDPLVEQAAPKRTFSAAEMKMLADERERLEAIQRASRDDQEKFSQKTFDKAQKVRRSISKSVASSETFSSEEDEPTALPRKQSLNMQIYAEKESLLSAALGSPLRVVKRGSASSKRSSTTSSRGSTTEVTLAPVKAKTVTQKPKPTTTSLPWWVYVAVIVLVLHLSGYSGYALALAAAAGYVLHSQNRKPK